MTDNSNKTLISIFVNALLTFIEIRKHRCPKGEKNMIYYHNVCYIRIYTWVQCILHLTAFRHDRSGVTNNNNRTLIDFEHTTCT